MILPKTVNTIAKSNWNNPQVIPTHNPKNIYAISLAFVTALRNRINEKIANKPKATPEFPLITFITTATITLIIMIVLTKDIEDRSPLNAHLYTFLLNT